MSDSGQAPTVKSAMPGASLKDILGDNGGLAKRPSLGEEAVERLRELILLEKLPPGLALNERDLSETLGISRTPVREAIRQLEIDGLVSYSESRRPYVADPPLSQLADWLDVQGALEGLAGELVCERATDKELREIASLQELMVELAESQDRYRLFGIDMQFHSAIVSAAHNPALSDTHKTFNARLWRARYVSAKQMANQATQVRKHQDIVEALLARNGVAASKALRQHLANAIKNIKNAYAARGKRQ